MPGLVSFTGAALSLTLVLVAVALSRWQRMGVESSILWASLRAAVQLLAVGFVLIFVLRSSFDWWLTGVWIVAMVLISAGVVQRRVKRVDGLFWPALAAIGGSTAVSLLLIFIPDVIDPSPVALIVTAGITIGNTMPGTVLGVRMTAESVIDRRGEVEGLLALGFDGPGATRFIASQAARNSLLPQIERTKVVGLIALPGALTGLLLAGVDPLPAVLTQLVVMFLVLGSVATSVVIVTTVVARRALTPDLRLADWTVPRGGPGGT
jgi:putative ABC transport system permease protein